MVVAKMKCQSCFLSFPEAEIQLSHDVPCYLFVLKSTTRRGRSNLADKFGRHYLCHDCHQKYEQGLNESLIATCVRFRNKFFEKDDDTKTITG